MQKLSHPLVLCLFSVLISSCSSIFKSNLPAGLMVASDICSSQKHSDCHYDYDTYEDSYQPPLQMKEEEKEFKFIPETKELNVPSKVKVPREKQGSFLAQKTENIKPNSVSKVNRKNQDLHKTTVKERYKIAVEINDISTERAIDKIKNSNQYGNVAENIKQPSYNIDTSTKDIVSITKQEQASTSENLQKNKQEKQNQISNTIEVNKTNGNKINPDILKAKIKSDFFLEEVEYSDLPGFTADNIKPAFDEFLKACVQFTKDENKWIKSDQIAIDRHHMLDICKDGENIKIDLYKYQKTEQDKVMEGFFVRWFSPYKVFSHGKDTGTFTGYYEAHIKGSTKATCDYLYPIYGLPDNPEHQKFTREEINNGLLRGKAKILFWAKNPVDIYLTQIQGSGVVETEDGKQYRIGYAGNNGYQFTGTGETIKKMGLHPEKGLSMTSIRDYLNKNPEIAKKVMNANKRFIFFKENKQDGAIGTFGTTLTAKQTIAVDQSYIPLGMPVYIDVKSPSEEPLNRITIAADTGAAIKGGIRADFFFGFGESALKHAGRMKQIGKYFILLPKNQDKFMVKSDNIQCLN